MSYNRVGLGSVRGTGTSGYIQSNKAAQRTEGVYERREAERAAASQADALISAATGANEKSKRAADPSIVAHEQARRVESALFDLRDELEDQGMPEQEIEAKITQERKRLTQIYSATNRPVTNSIEVDY